MIKTRDLIRSITKSSDDCDEKGMKIKFKVADGSLKQLTDMATLFKIALVIPPATSNVEHVVFLCSTNLFAAENIT